VVLGASQAATTNYTAATASTSFTVSPATPVITWPTPSAVTNGTALSATQLNATASTPGTFVYSPASGTVPTVGTQTLSVTFTPTDTTDYNSATATATLTVNKATPAINWATPGAITYGTALSATQLNATASVAGTFAYSPASGTVPTAGTQVLSVTFTPTDTTDYNSVTAIVTLTVNSAQSGQETPDISWLTPAAISYGTALSSTQLNASASYNGTVVPGTFEYTPAAGEVLDSGSQTLLVAFFPNDSTTYSTAGGSVQLQVIPSASDLPQTFYYYCIPDPSNNYCSSFGYNSAGPGYDGAGNLKYSIDLVTGSWSFNYDTLNRLIAGMPAPGSSANNGNNLCWSYDPFGNRTAQSSQNTPCPTLPSTPTQTVYYNTNNQITGGLVTYDAAGDVAMDTNAGNTYLYDGEGRICAVMSEPVPNNSTMTAYVYDAEGNRVAKGVISSWPTNGLCPNLAAAGVFTPTASYVLGPSNEQLTETDGQGQWQHTNVYAAGTIIATYDQVSNPLYTNGGTQPAKVPALHFQLEDWLGSRRVQTNITGTVEEWYVSLPYGDGLTPIPNLGCLPSNNCYSEDPTEHHFTGKERDTESGNDYFDARYYSSAMGRFMSPDWSAKEEPVPYSKLDNPQTLNLYSYVVNNPLTQIDDDGHEIIYMTTGPNALQNEQVVRDSVTAILANPNTAGNLSGYVGKDNPDLVIMNGDLSKLDNPTQAPDGSPGASITKGDAEPVMSTSTDANGNKTDPQFSGAIITIDNRTSAGDTPSVMTHETVHAGEMKANPNQFVKDSAAEKNMPHDKRPQEQRANAAQNKYGPAITKAVKQMEKARKKEQQ
jgi:RHS repeat-associated protein